MPQRKAGQHRGAEQIDAALPARIEAAAQPPRNPLLNASHHSAEPMNTPDTTMVQGAATRPATSAIAPKMAMKEKIVAGFDRVSTKVPAKCRQGWQAIPTGVAEACGTGARSSCQAIHSRKAPPNRASGNRAADSAPISQATPKAPNAP